MTTSLGSKPAIYPPQRAVEHAIALDGVQPRRLFALLWPLFQVEIEADIYEQQAYEMLDKFITRGIAQTGLSTVEELASFFGLAPSLVRRVCDFLALIQHVEWSGETVRLTPLGYRSIHEGVRYEPKKSRQYLLFDKATMQPLPRDHYAGGIVLLDQPEVPAGSRYGVSFTALFTPAQFLPAAVEQLCDRADRTEYNVPAELTNLRQEGVKEAYLPVYLVETASTRTPYLAYTKVAGERDTFLEGLCGHQSVVASLARAEPTGDPREIWPEWLSARRLPTSGLHRLPNSVWRATLPPSAFGIDGATFSLSQLGSFALRRQHFLQLWCEREAMRRDAVLHRVSAMRRVRSRSELREQLAVVARQLEVPAPDADDLSRHLAATGQATLRAWVDGLPEYDDDA